MPSIRTHARRAVKSLQRPFNWRSSLTIAGRRYVIPVIEGRRVEGSEPWMTTLLEQLLAERPGPFVDVGVNLGQTMLKVCAIDPQRPYVGFEPNFICAAYLYRLIRLNRLDNCDVYPAAVATQTGFMPLTLYDGETDSSATLVPGFRRRTGTPLNAAVMPGSALPLPEQIGVLKIDVEGGELDVVQGLLDAIRRARPVIVIEVLPDKGEADRLRRQEQLQALLFGEGYRAERIVTQGGELAALEPVGEIGRGRTKGETDFVFRPAH